MDSHLYCTPNLCSKYNYFPHFQVYGELEEVSHDRCQILLTPLEIIHFSIPRSWVAICIKALLKNVCCIKAEISKGAYLGNTQKFAGDVITVHILGTQGTFT